MKIRVLVSAVLFFTSVFYSCTKENETTALKIRMTDAPVAMEEVNIDLLNVQVKFATDTSKWVDLDTHAGVYNLLGLQNGVDSLIAQGIVPTGVVKEIRLVVGADNNVKVDGQTYPLTIPSGAESGLKIKVNKNLQATIETLLIDFDAALSIQEESDGYKLRPVVKLR